MTVQFIELEGRRAFAVLPYDEYNELLTVREKEKQILETTIPNEVVDIMFDNSFSLLKAWRIYLRLKQSELARTAGISSSALSQMERSEKPHKMTLAKLGKAMGVNPDLLTMED